jgi:hypothetical protein
MSKTNWFYRAFFFSSTQFCKRDYLIREISKDEVEQTIMDMAAGKSPRLDGFTTNFLHKCWSVVGADV